MLVFGNACWALSFPTMKAMTLLHQPLLPHSSSWFITGLTLMFRFALATLVMLVICSRTLRNLTALEIWQGAGLGLFAGVGFSYPGDTSHQFRHRGFLFPCRGSSILSESRHGSEITRVVATP